MQKTTRRTASALAPPQRRSRRSSGRHSVFLPLVRPQPSLPLPAPTCPSLPGLTNNDELPPDLGHGASLACGVGCRPVVRVGGRQGWAGRV